MGEAQVEGAVALQGLTPLGTPASGIQALPREHRGRGVEARWPDDLVPCIPLTHPHRSVRAQRKSA